MEPIPYRMKLAKQFIFYLGLIIVFGGLIFYLLHVGKYQDVPDILIKHSLPEGGFFADIFRSNFQEALPRLLLQIIIIIISSQLLASLFKKIGQPPVIGEIVAGIILGPSL